MHLIRLDYFAFFFVAFSRGLIELFVGRELAYAGQVLFIVLALCYLFKFRFYYSRLAVSVFLLFLSFFSLLYTYISTGYFEFRYVLVILFVLFLYNLVSLEFRRTVFGFQIVNSLLAVGYILLFVALLQQLRLLSVELPGATVDFFFVRPQSLTGSYLHYPIIISSISLLSLVAFIVSGRKFYLFTYILILITLLFSLSRNGIFIAGLGGVLLFFNLRHAFLVCLIALGIFAFAALLAFINPEWFEVIVSRIGGSFSSSSEGNDTRFDLWMVGISYLSWTSIFFGNLFGLVTNSASDEAKNFFSVVESSLLQQVLNIGVVGTFVFYFVLFSRYFTDLSLPHVRRIGFVLFLSSLFYQSVEVIPFIVILYFLSVVTYPVLQAK